ncbi:MAG: 50S ribosomal protein L11 methyltransferase [Verrucomicrobiota bacterium]
MTQSVFQLSVSIRENAEEKISLLFQDLFGRAPTIYTDADTRKTTASIFLEKKSDWSRSMKTRFQSGLELLRASGIQFVPGKFQFKKLQRQDWAESWKKHFKPIKVGKTLLIKPSWSRVQPGKDQACVILDPGLSFGTGQHATTLFCLEQIARCRRTEQTQSFLDMGTGSGILAISAAKLGYSRIEAFDLDPESVRVSRNNAEENKVADRVRPMRRDLTKLPLRTKIRFDVICANLIYDLLIEERERIVNRLAPKGSLILAGILQTQFPKVKVAFEAMGMKLDRTKKGKEWQSGRFVFEPEVREEMVLKLH